MPIAAATVGSMSGLIIGTRDQAYVARQLANARPGEYISLPGSGNNVAGLMQASPLRAFPPDMMANAAPRAPVVKNRAGQTYTQWCVQWDARQGMADASGIPISDRELRSKEAGLYEWEMLGVR